MLWTWIILIIAGETANGDQKNDNTVHHQDDEQEVEYDEEGEYGEYDEEGEEGEEGEEDEEQNHHYVTQSHSKYIFILINSKIVHRDRRRTRGQDVCLWNNLDIN